jgi:hypothetical protein
MPRVGFEPTVPASERTKTVHALDHSVSDKLHAQATLTPGKEFSISIWVPERVCGLCGEQKYLAPTGTRTRDSSRSSSPVASTD